MNNMTRTLIAKLGKVAQTHPDAAVRAAAKRDAEGYTEALHAKTSNLFLQYGGKVHPVASAKEAGDIWREIILEAMKLGLGPEDMKGKPLLVDASGKRVGYLSWNGRAWKRDGVPFDADAARSLNKLHADLNGGDNV